MNRKWILAIMLLGLVPIGGARAACTQYREHLKGVVGEFDVPLYSPGDVALVGQIACLPSPMNMQLIDVSDPERPTEVGAIPVGDPRGIVSVGTRVYVADGGARLLRVIEVADPANPVELASVSTPDWAMDVAVSTNFVSGRYAYVACRQSGVLVINVSNPTAPQTIAQVMGDAEAIAAANVFVYAANRSEFRVIDVSSLSSPVVTGTVQLNGEVRNIVVSGDHAFLAGDAGLQVIDVSDPYAPLLVGHAPTANPIGYGVAVSGHVAFVSSNENSTALVPEGCVETFDVSDPANPAWIGRASTTAAARRLEIRENYAYVVNWMTSAWPPTSPGLDILDVTNMTSPGLIGRATLSGYAFKAAMAGTRAAVATTEGLDIVELADPSAPRTIGHLGGMSYSVVARGTLAFLATPSGVSVVDLHVPSSPRQIGATQCSVWSLALRGDYLFGIYGPRNMKVIDVSDPTHPFVAAEYAVAHSVIGVDISGDLLALAGSSGVEIVDISNPLAPARVASYYEEYPWGEDSPGVEINGDVVYFSDGYEGLKTLRLDLETGTLDLVNQLVLPGHFSWSDILGTTLYVASDRLGVRMFDISDPGRPAMIGTFDTDGSPEDVLVQVGGPTEDMLLVCDYWDRALEIAPLQCQAAGVGERAAADRVAAIDAFPNPSRDAIAFRLDGRSLDEARLQILDAAGRIVRSLAAKGPAGRITLRWDGRDERGRLVPAGVYFARAPQEGVSRTRTVVVTR